jgi:peptide/nickel transport system substrate-binding protein
MAQSAEEIDRRKLLRSLGTATAVGIAGCQGQQSDEDDQNGDTTSETGTKNKAGTELGERVGTIVIGAPTGGSNETAKTARDNWEERLGVDVEIKVMQSGPWIQTMLKDDRKYHMGVLTWVSSPNRLEPTTMMNRASIVNAGNQGKLSPSHYANCEYSSLVQELNEAPDDETRRELVNKASEIISKDVARINIIPAVEINGVNKETTTLNRAGEAGLSGSNVYPIFYSEVSGDAMTISADAEMSKRTDYFSMAQQSASFFWTNFILSPLIERGENTEIKNVLAENIEVTNQAKQITVEIVDDATFTNGNQITAEDVKATFDIAFGQAGDIPRGGEPPFDSTEIIDDLTVQFNFTAPALPVLGFDFLSWGIMEKEMLEEHNVADAPTEFEFPQQNPVGSGPFKLEQMAEGQLVHLTPRDNHPAHSPNHAVQLRTFDNPETTFQSFKAGELNIFREAGQFHPQLESLPNAEVVTGGGFMPKELGPNCAAIPTKFRAVRAALSASLDRQNIAETVAFGTVDPVMKNSIFVGDHPWRPPDELLHTNSESPSGSEEEARAYLREAGFGWDEDGNLRFPKDADLNPLWPAEGTPSEEDFPCLSELG